MEASFRDAWRSSDFFLTDLTYHDTNVPIKLKISITVDFDPFDSSPLITN